MTCVTEISGQKLAGLRRKSLGRYAVGSRDAVRERWSGLHSGSCPLELAATLFNKGDVAHLKPFSQMPIVKANPRISGAATCAFLTSTKRTHVDQDD